MVLLLPLHYGSIKLPVCVIGYIITLEQQERLYKLSLVSEVYTTFELTALNLTWVKKPEIQDNNLEMLFKLAKTYEL